jgi:hypothetical protein
MIAVEANPFTSLDATAATGPGAEWPAGGYRTPAVQLVGIIDTDIVQVEASIDGANWEQLGEDIVADGVFIIEAGAGLLRANFTDDTGGGTITAIFLGH